MFTRFQLQSALVTTGVLCLPLTTLAGGPMSASMMPVPPNPAGSVTIDVSVMREVAPDYVTMTAYCDTGPLKDRNEVKATIGQITQVLRTAAGSDARVRRGGGLTISPYYENGAMTSKFSGNVQFTVRFSNIAASARVASAAEDQNCGVNWDARMQDTQAYELSLIDELRSKLDKRKVVFEKLLGEKLKNMSSVNIMTSMDGWNYDPETQKADATTTLTVTYGTSGASGGDSGNGGPVMKALNEPMKR